MKEKFKHAHMEVAYVYGRLSYCQRRKVGCVVVLGDRIISIGYNGTKPGESNVMQDEHGNTLPTVIHAEKNALDKISGYDLSQAVLFTTLAPCANCAELIIDSGIRYVLYSEEYRLRDGILKLEEAGIVVEQVTIGEK